MHVFNLFVVLIFSFFKVTKLKFRFTHWFSGFQISLVLPFKSFKLKAKSNVLVIITIKIIF